MKVRVFYEFKWECSKGNFDRNVDPEIVKIILDHKGFTKEHLCAVVYGGDTVFHMACEIGNPIIVKLILESRYITNKFLTMKNSFDNTALDLIDDDKDSSSEIFKLILNHKKANQLLNKIGFNGYTFMHVMCIRGRKEIIKILVESNNVSLVEKTNKEGETFLHTACKYGQKEIVEFALESERIPLHILEF